MTKIITNKLRPEILDISSIATDFDIFEIARDGEKWVSASVLSVENDVIKAESVVYGGTGNVFYMMFRKNATSRDTIIKEFAKCGHSDYNPKLIKSLSSSPLANADRHLLIQLLLNSLGNSNMPSRKFNNVTGRLYYATRAFKRGNKIWFLDINVDREINLNASVVTYTKVPVSDEIRKYTKYVYDKDRSIIRRTDTKEIERKSIKEVYIRRSKGKKSVVSFLEYDSRMSLENSKVGALAVIVRLSERLKPYLSLSFEEKEVTDSSMMIGGLESFGTGFDKIRLLYDEQHEVIADAFKTELAKFNVAAVSDSPDTDLPSLSFIAHGKDYYTERELPDPYTNADGTYMQHVDCSRFYEEETMPEVLNDKAKVLVSVMTSAIINELKVKQDIHNGIVATVCLQDFGYTERMTFMKCYSQEDKEDIYVFFDLEPSGNFTSRVVDFNMADIDACDDDLDVIAAFESLENRSDIELVFYKSADGIYLIRKTGERTLPQSLAVWQDISKIRPEERYNKADVLAWFMEFASRSMCEMTDTGYNRQLEGIKANLEALGEQTTSKEIHAAICLQTRAGKDFNRFLQEEKDVWVFHNIKKEELDGIYRMSSFLGVKYWPTEEKPGTYSYVVGLLNRWNSFKFYKIDKGSVIRRIEGIGCEPPKDVVEMIISMTRVDFVRQGGYTVLAFVNKYIEEIYRSKF